MLAAMSSNAISVPNAGALTLVAKRARRIMALQIAHDACQLAKEKAALGWTYLKVNTDELSCGKHLNKMTNGFRLEALRDAAVLLKDAGYKPYDNSGDGFFRYNPKGRETRFIMPVQGRVFQNSYMTFCWS